MVRKEKEKNTIKKIAGGVLFTAPVREAPVREGKEEGEVRPTTKDIN